MKRIELNEKQMRYCVERFQLIDTVKGSSVPYNCPNCNEPMIPIHLTYNDADEVPDKDFFDCWGCPKCSICFYDEQRFNAKKFLQYIKEI